MTNTWPQLSVLTATTARRSYTLSYVDRPSSGPAILYVHGRRCSGSEAIGMKSAFELQTFRLVSADNSGCGDSPYDDNHPLNIAGVVELMESFVAHWELNRFLLVGGSMGGLVALLYAERNPNEIAGFVNAPKDCMFSRSVVPHSYSISKRSYFLRSRGPWPPKQDRDLRGICAYWRKLTPAPTTITLSRPSNIQTTEICWIGFSVSRHQNVFCMARRTVTSRTCNDSVSPNASS